LIGELITLDAFVSYAGKTSMEVTVQVHAENIQTGAKRHTNTAHVTMVAIKNERPTAVPKLICETRDDKVRYLEGKLRREMRSVMNVNQQRMTFGFMNATDEQLDDLVAGDSLI
jgi:acyl-CoA hydrolase